MLRTLLVRAALAGVAVVAACDSKSDAAASSTEAAGPRFKPTMTAELVAPAAKGMIVGTSTKKEFDAAFKSSEVIVDKRIGGNAKVEYNGEAATHVIIAAASPVRGGTAWFSREADGTDRLQHLELRLETSDTCAWNTTTLGKVEGTNRRPGSNRKFGGPSSYTAGIADGSKAVGIECNTSTIDGVASEVLSYGVDAESGTSKTMSREP